MSIFKLEAIVDILTGKAVSQLDALDKRGQATARAMENLQRRIDRASAAADRNAKRMAELKEKVEAGGDGARKAERELAKLEKTMYLAGLRTERLKAQMAELQRSSNAGAGAMEKWAQTALRFAGPAVLGAVSAVVVKLALEIAKFATTAHDAMQRFQAATGASVAETKRFGDALQKLYSQNTDSVEALAGTLSAVRREFGDLGDRIEAVTQRFLDFAKVTGTDAAEGVDALHKTLSAYGLTEEELVAVTHRLEVAHQKTGVGALELARAMTELAPTAAAAHLSFQDVLTVVTAFAAKKVSTEEAVKDLTKVVTAATEGGAKYAHAFKLLGLEVDALGRPVGGAKALLGALVEKFSDGKDAAGDLRVASDLVGDRLKTEFIRALSDGSGALAAFAEAFDSPKDAITEASKTFDEQFGEKAELIFRKHFALTGEMGTNWQKVIKWILDSVDALLTGIEDMGTMLGNMVNSVEASIGKVVDGVGQMWAGLEKLVKHSLAIIADDILSLLDQLPKAIQEKLGGVRGSLAETSKRFRAESRGDQGLWDSGLASVKEGVRDFLPQQIVTQQLPGTGFGLPNLLQTVLSAKAFSPGEIAPRTPKPEDTPDPQKNAEKLKKPVQGTGDDDAAAREAAAAQARKDTAQALKDLEFYVTKKKALNQLSTAEELQLYQRVLAARRIGNTQLVLDEEQRRKLILETFQLQGRLADDAAKERKKREAEERKAKEDAAKLDADLHVKLVALTQGDLAGKIAALDKERDAYLKVTRDKQQVEEWYQASRKDLEDKANQAILDKRKDLTKQLEQETLQALGQQRRLQLEAIKDTAQKALEQKVDPAVVSKWLDAKEKEINKQFAPAGGSAAGGGDQAAQQPGNGSLLGKGDFTTGGTYEAGDVAGAFSGWGTKPEQWHGFASSKKEEASGAPGDLTRDQVKSEFAGIRAQVQGGGEQRQSYEQRFGTGGGPLTGDQLAARMYSFTQRGDQNLAAAAGGLLAPGGGPGKGASFGAANEIANAGKFGPCKPQGAPPVEVKIEWVGGPIKLEEDASGHFGGWLDAKANTRLTPSPPPGF